MVVVVVECDDVVGLVTVVELEVAGEVLVVVVCVGDELGTVGVVGDECGVVVGDSSVDVPPKHPLASTNPTINNVTSILKLFFIYITSLEPTKKRKRMYMVNGNLCTRTINSFLTL
ncbi:hypothetical protein [Thermococcus piezophilus]|uniref:hypothetical protein n=1 Tax=Thermococcus piezophilus TaxID=1712654 RepID=UPI0009EE506B|nr:hypothetical protein [Thermococcus piezophilus]